MYKVNNKPESELPWKYMPYCDMHGIPDYLLDKDEAFILHACNAYPKLIELLKDYCIDDYPTEAERFLKELGELDA